MTAISKPRGQESHSVGQLFAIKSATSVATPSPVIAQILIYHLASRLPIPLPLLQREFQHGRVSRGHAAHFLEIGQTQLEQSLVMALPPHIPGLNRLFMSGAFQSDYMCTSASWKIFLSKLRDTDFFIDEGDQIGAASTFLKIKRHSSDTAEVWLEKQSVLDHKANVEMHWHTPNKGEDNRSLLKIAFQIEKALLDEGAVCLQGEVAPFAAKFGLVKK